MTKPRIGIVGYGDFGQLMARHLTGVADVVVSTRQPKHDTNTPVQFEDEKTVLAQPIVIPSMPAQYLEEYFAKNGQFLRPNALVVDICSVKVKPIEILTRILPESVSILASHPMFGPASATNSLKNQKIMLHPVRIQKSEYEKVKHFLSEVLGLKIIETTPEAHDHTMAYVQGLSHYLGRVMDNMKIPETDLATQAYVDLLDMKRIQGGDSWELFESIMKENPYAHEVHQQFVNACQQLDKQLSI